MRRKWQDRAECLEMGNTPFFPHDTLASARWDVARKICAVCPVCKECLDMVIGLEDADDRWGMFGGYTPAERRKLRYERDEQK